jgi:hypothetical protein
VRYALRAVERCRGLILRRAQDDALGERICEERRRRGGALRHEVRRRGTATPARAVQDRPCGGSEGRGGGAGPRSGREVSLLQNQTPDLPAKKGPSSTPVKLGPNGARALRLNRSSAPSCLSCCSSTKSAGSPVSAARPTAPTCFPRSNWWSCDSRPHNPPRSKPTRSKHKE